MSLLEMRGIDKSFGEVKVLDNVDLTVEKGQVHALLGENGAGKSTLMNILTGVHARNAGSIEFNGVPLTHITIRHSEQMGIAFVHQELNLFNDLKVFENIFLGKEYTNKIGRLDKRRMIQEAGAHFGRLGVSIDPLQEVSRLKASEKQLLEIAKALFFEAKLLILDEPTTALNREEVAHLFRIIKELKKGGTSFIFISHKMPEIFELADHYTVLRNGKYIRAGEIAESSPEEVTRLMVGEKLAQEHVYQKRAFGAPVLELLKLSGRGFYDINFQASRGEIVGLTGLQGSGSSELMQCIFGAHKASSGRIKVKGKEVNRPSIHKLMSSGTGMLAVNRKENSVIPDMTLLENMYLAEHTLSAWRFHIRRKQEEGRFQNYKQILNMKVQKSSDPIFSLSGGNQQKLFIARWLNTDADILLLDNPTQGIDVGAKAEIYKLILKLANEGKTILINTLEIPELQKVADKCLVFYNGRIAKVLNHEEIDETTVMLYSTNAVDIKESSSDGG